LRRSGRATWRSTHQGFKRRANRILSSEISKLTRNENTNMETNLDNLTWQGNSKSMYDRVLEKTPAPFRKMTGSKLRERLSAKLGESDVITEDMVIAAVSETIPPPFTKKSVEAISKMRTGA
jgi:hypothetical protein